MNFKALFSFRHTYMFSSSCVPFSCTRVHDAPSRTVDIFVVLLSLFRKAVILHYVHVGV